MRCIIIVALVVWATFNNVFIPHLFLQSTSESSYPPIGRRFFVALALCLFGAGLDFYSVTVIGNGYRRTGYCFFALGTLIIFIAFGLWWLTGLRWTWGWWL